MSKMFTDKFLKVPIEICVKAEQEVMGDSAPSSIVMIRIDPTKIIIYRPDPGTDTDTTKRVVVDFEGGSYQTILLSVREFEKMINEFMANHA